MSLLSLGVLQYCSGFMPKRRTAPQTNVHISYSYPVCLGWWMAELQPSVLYSLEINRLVVPARRPNADRTFGLSCPALSRGDPERQHPWTTTPVIQSPPNACSRRGRTEDICSKHIMVHSSCGLMFLNSRANAINTRAKAHKHHTVLRWPRRERTQPITPNASRRSVFIQ